MRNREQSNWGLALLMRPTKAVPDPPSANLPLREHPDIVLAIVAAFLAGWCHFRSHRRHLRQSETNNSRVRSVSEVPQSKKKYIPKGPDLRIVFLSQNHT